MQIQDWGHLIFKIECKIYQILVGQNWGTVDCIWCLRNDDTIGLQKFDLLSHPNATLAPQARASGENLNYMPLAPQTRQARASGEILNYVTLAPQGRPSGEILNYLLSH